MASAKDSHAEVAPSAIRSHPPLPAITDEAADTPMWVPMAGLALFLALAFFVAIRAALAPAEEPSSTEETPPAGVDAPATE